MKHHYTRPGTRSESSAFPSSATKVAQKHVGGLNAASRYPGLLPLLILIITTTLLTGNPALAQTVDMQMCQPSDGADYRGYAIKAHNYGDPGIDGYLAVGNRLSGNSQYVHDKIHVLTLPDMGSTSPASYGYNIGIQDVRDMRAVAITPAGSYTNAHGRPCQLSAVVIQARDNPSYLSDHVAVLILDSPDPSLTPSVTAAFELADGNNVNNLYPTGAVYNGADTLFICGFATETQPYPYAEPTFADDKQAFVASLVLSTGVTNIAYFNTPQYLSAPPSWVGWTGTAYNDYDHAQRIRIVNGRLIVTGAGNMTGNVGSPNLYQVNTSATWIAMIDGATLSIISGDYFGPATAYNAVPDELGGVQGVDVVTDGANGAGYYIVQSSVQLSAPYAGGLEWYVTHADEYNPAALPPTNFQASLLGGNNNTLEGYAFKLYGATTQAATGNARLSMYGYGPPVPQSTTFSLDLSWSSSGIGGNNAVRRMIPTFNPLPVPDPFWLSSDLGAWGLPDCAARFGKGSGASVDYLARIDHYVPSTGRLIPRFTQAGPDGEYLQSMANTQLCIESQPEDSVVDAENFAPPIPSISATISSGQLSASTPTVSVNGIAHYQYSCHIDRTFRMAHTNSGTAAASSGSAAGIAVWPNPASDYVSVSWEMAVGTQDEPHIILSDLAGRTVYAGAAEAVQSTSVRFALPSLPKGLYIASFTLKGNANKATVKLNIQ